MKQLDLSNRTILVTGSAGFIGATLTNRLCKEYENIRVIGLDNINDYYDVKLKKYRIDKLLKHNNFEFIKGDIVDKELVHKLFEEYKPSIVVNLAAQAGARDSINNPDTYIETNIIGFYNILEACKKYPVDHLVYASSSSVYGDEPVPYKEIADTNKPTSLYGATKKCDEVLAYSYSNMYKIPTTGLRFFTVYGSAGRPDMAYFKFTDKLIKGETIKIYNYGNCQRDFTYIDDIVEGIMKVIQGVPIEEIPYSIYNIGNSNPISILDFVNILQEELIKEKLLPENYNFEEHKELIPMQLGDVLETYADSSKLEKDFGYKPNTPLKTGLRKFVKWYKEFYMKKDE